MPKDPDPDILLISKNLSAVRNIIFVLSGKGGVGKSTFTSNLARKLANNQELSIGVLDVDICGPSQPQLFGVQEQEMHPTQFGLSPVYCGENDNIALASVGFFLNNQEDAVIWKGPKKNMLIKKFLKDVEWGELDYLLIDTPPGTSDEHLSLAQLIKERSSCILVTTPQEVAWQDVRKEIDFCCKTKIPIIGIVENMCGFVCPNCQTRSDVFYAKQENKIKLYAEENGLNYLASIPVDPSIGKACDSGLPMLESISNLYENIAAAIIRCIEVK
jgi:Mrp family chromosome partitioning ATPase